VSIETNKTTMYEGLALVPVRGRKARAARTINIIAGAANSLALAAPEPLSLFIRAYLPIKPFGFTRSRAKMIT
jgi:hypothetical protein